MQKYQALRIGGDLTNLEQLWKLLPRLENLPPVEIAEVLFQHEDTDIWKILSTFRAVKQAAIFSEFPTVRKLALFKVIPAKKFIRLFEHIEPDIRADFFQHLTDAEKSNLLRLLRKGSQQALLSLSSYPPDSAAGIMTTAFATLKEGMSCGAALAKIRREKLPPRTLSTLYVIDKQWRIVGVLTLEELVLANPQASVRQIMNRNIVSVSALEDRKEAIAKISKYDLMAIPVLNKTEQIIGVITADDAIDALRAEESEDMQKFMGITGTDAEFDYLGTSAWQHFRRRATWLVSLAALGLVSGIIIHRYEKAFEKLMILALVISLALALQVITSTIIGALLPLGVKALGGDPAVAASPAITTIVDITGLLIYFSMAALFLGL